MLLHETARCTGCGTCAYVCSPGAIAVRQRDASIAWEFSAGRCTFCGRCAEYCPTSALAFECATPAAMADLSRHRLAHEVTCRPCPRCRRPVVSMPLEVLARLYGGAAPETLVAQHGLCERCRRRSAAAALRPDGR
jgi:hydrogenase-4 component H